MKPKIHKRNSQWLITIYNDGPFETTNIHLDTWKAAIFHLEQLYLLNEIPNYTPRTSAKGQIQ